MTGRSGFTDLVAYKASGPGIDGLTVISCPLSDGSVIFSVKAGTTYYLQAGNAFFGPGGLLQVNVQEIQPPPNDDFADARAITALPFSDTLDVTGATTEAGEPPSCGPGGINESISGGSVWYAFTPGASGSITARSGSSTGEPLQTVIAAYTGNSLTELSQVGCHQGGPLTLHVVGGTTYYFQTGTVFRVPIPFQFRLEVAPDPAPGFFFFPFDPTIFDTVQFFDQSVDPGGVGIASQTWDLGDGTTATGCCPTHRYAADGDYTARLTVTTVDGRTASTSQVVQVRTHDVAITKFTVPKAASAGQTRQITVGVNSNRYPETVQVQLFKSVAGGGFQEIGNLTKSVPASGANRTTSFSFSYTFTSDDAAIGKVTFKGIANLVGARDALPADNEAIASPTKVSH